MPGWKLVSVFILAAVLFLIVVNFPKRTGNQTETMDAQDVPEDPEEELWYYIERDLRAGYDAPDDILNMAIDVLSDEYNEKVLTDKATAILPETMKRLHQEAESWPETTDCDRLDLAFATLEAKGIICRQNFSCCGTCGSGEIWDEMQKLKTEEKDVRGYAFFHQQDTESAVDGYGLYLNYGAIEEGEEAALTVASKVVEVLSAFGLESEWDGTWAKRIGVEVDWKRRGKWLREYTTSKN